MTRRVFLQLVGQVGGASAVYAAMGAMDLLAQRPTSSTSAPTSSPFKLSGNGNGRRILILGAGMAGLCAAYELGKVGYDCAILEARTRVGGRVQTIRRGDVIVESDGRSQTCEFDTGEYFNPGATRFPQHHCTIDYCRELRVPIEAFGNLNESAFLYRASPGALSGTRVRYREARADLSGYVCELLAKAVSKSDLDLPLTAGDKASLLHYLAMEGGLSRDMVYRGEGWRRGYRVWPGAGTNAGESDDAFPIGAILQSGFGMMFGFNWNIEQQMQMFQVVGGMDRLADAFAERVGINSIELAGVREIDQSPTEVIVHYTDRLGRDRERRAEFCVCTIPLPVLRHIPCDVSEKMRRAIANVDCEPAVKIGLQFKRRFWEVDDRIFSGIWRTDQSIQQIIYPSCGYLSDKGVLVGCYNFGDEAIEMGKLPPAARIERALREGEKIHPQYRAEFETGVSVAWQKTPFSLGAFTGYDDQARREHYPVLNEPDGRIYLAGEHLSYLTGWIAGALESARRVSRLVHDRACSQ